MPAVSVFGSSKVCQGSLEYLTAEDIGRLLSLKGFDIVTGGYGGVMEAALKGAVPGKSKRIGITCSKFTNRKVNDYVEEEIPNDDYLERLKKLINIADAYVVLPGGVGTLLELASVWTFRDRKFITEKPIVCVGELWNETIETFRFYSEEFLDKSGYIKIVDSASDAVEFILSELNKQ